MATDSEYARGRLIGPGLRTGIDGDRAVGEEYLEAEVTARLGGDVGNCKCRGTTCRLGAMDMGTG